MTDDVQSDIALVLDDLATSYWLRDALCTALNRDPLDAASDAMVLSMLLGRRLDMLLGPDRGRTVIT